MPDEIGLKLGIMLGMTLVVAIVSLVVNWRRHRRAEAEALNRAYIERQRRETLRKAAGEYQHQRRRER